MDDSIWTLLAVPPACPAAAMTPAEAALFRQKVMSLPWFLKPREYHSVGGTSGTCAVGDNDDLMIVGGSSGSCAVGDDDASTAVQSAATSIVLPIIEGSSLLNSVGDANIFDGFEAGDDRMNGSR